MLISNVLFECDSVSAFKIPPGPVTLSKWTPKIVVWKGSLRLIEEEQTSVEPDAAPYSGLRLKLELYNKKASDAVREHFRDHKNTASWADVWYNPFSETELHYKVANDGSDTIVMAPESPKYYKVIAQLPDTGYCALDSSEKGFLLQVALGLQFDDSFHASSFSESMAIYKRHFHNFQEKFLYDSRLSSLEHSVSNSLTLPNTDPRPTSPLADDDEFGSFVGSSYD